MRDYNENCNKADRIGNESFRKLCMAITNHDQKAKQAIDYVAGLLLHDNFDLITKIIRSKEKESEAQQLEKLVNTLDAYLKGRFENHLGTSCFAKPSFAFDRIKSTTETCEACQLPMKVMNYLSDHTPLIHNQLLNDCREKILLYMGYRVRVKNQRDAIDNIVEKMKDHQAVALMDYKMKFECKCHREKTSDFYGKKAYHGIAL